MPACGCLPTAVAVDVIFFLGRSHLRRFAGIEAHGNNFEFLAEIELDHLHGAGQSGENLATKHGAVVVREVKDQWLVAEVVSQSDGRPGFIAEGEFGGKLSVAMLLDADVLQTRRADSGRGGEESPVPAPSPN